MYRVRLNRLQRGALLAAAAVIATIALAQINSVGFEDTPWLTASVVIVVLVLLALVEARPESDSKPSPAQSPVRPTPNSDLRPHYLTAVKRLGVFLRAKLGELPRDAPVQFLGETGGFVDGVALRGAFMLVLLGRELSHEGYTETDEVWELRRLVVGNLTNAQMQDLRREADGPVRRDDLIKQATVEIAKCEIAVRTVLKNNALATPYPNDPIFKVINNELALALVDSPEARANTYGAIAEVILGMK